MDFAPTLKDKTVIPRKRWPFAPRHGPRRRLQIIVTGVLALLLLYRWTGFGLPNTFELQGTINKSGTPVSQLTLPTHDYAFAAFLSEPEQSGQTDDDDVYFIATRMLAYQLLHDPETRTNNSIPFLVLVTDEVEQSKRERLAADGATIVPVGKISFDWIQASRNRWRDVMSKLHLFDMTQYQRIFFLDSDILIVKRMDGIFDDPAAQVQQNKMDPASVASDESTQPSGYVFAGVSGQGGFDHPFPGRVGQAVNAGCVMLRPSHDLFLHYLSVASIEARFDSKYPEQNLWNYVHRRSGNMPWQQLDPTWNVNWPTMNDYVHGVASLHAKWWSPGPEPGLRDVALKSRWKMEGNAEARDRSRFQ